MRTRTSEQRTCSITIALMLFSCLGIHAQTRVGQFDASNEQPSPPISSAANSGSSISPDLPDAPVPQAAQSQAQTAVPAKQDEHTQINTIALLSPRLINGQPLTVHDKFEIYIHKAYSPAAVIFPLFGTGLKMARPNQNYPPEWQDGMGAFGRNYGDAVARRTAETTAEFATQALFHEDPRYGRSTSTNPIVRMGHAVVWTFVDKSDSGHSMPAISTFTGAAAGSFVGMAYLPDGFNDVSHAESRMIGAIGGRAVSNVLVEFEPTWGPFVRRLHIPRILPAWWTSDHR